MFYCFAKEYAEDNGHTRIPANYKTKEGHKLGVWISNQRANKDTMSTERKIKLELLPKWSWNPLLDAWEIGFSHAKEFAVNNGHLCVPASFVTPDGYNLGLWICNQRQNKKKGALSLEFKARLEGLPKWCWDVLTEKFEYGLFRICEYAMIKGHARVPNAYKADDGYGLGEFVSGLRKRKSNLPDDRILKLEELPGWSWDPFANKWEKGFLCAKEFAVEHGHAKIPCSYKAKGGYRLGMWASHQRSGKDKLTIERKERLESLPGWVWAFI